MADQETLSFFGENRSLFSDHYLKERLSRLPEWDQDISEPFETALEIYQDKKSVLPGMNEAQTENEFIQPILEQVLDFSYDVQKAERKQGRINIPDYILFPDGDALKVAQQKPEGDSSYYNEALTLSDAKYWERPLDSKSVSEKDRFTNNNPSFQIIKYLTVTGLEWGILTNGSHWRLYSTKARSRIDSYFEVDLKRILEEEDKDQFRYFYHFFRKQAYQADPQTGQSFIERVFEGSIDYGSRLENRLKDLIFEDVFLELSKGFVHYRSEEEGIEQEADESLQEIYQGTLRLLYRLLFLLHAESRSLLPLDNKGYLQYSLMELKKDIANRIDEDLPQSSRSFDVWNDLDSLFHIIDRGDPDLNVPRYNGGLFRQDHPNNTFLNEHKISDKFLVPALEKLTRETEPNEVGRKPFIDYKSLNVEQLGSIYEGLLEFHLRQTDGDDGLELYLENDKGERKATGSYYTPHYIVEYIVEHTLGPVFEERAETFEDLMVDWLPQYEQIQKLDQKIQDGDRSERTHNKRKELDLETRTLGKRATETLLNLKICDPAMGSGHFLKEATDKLAEKIITLLAEYPENPVSLLLEDVRQQIMESLEEQDISIDAEEHLKDTNLIKRMVMKRSIYGVDLNPMAVELAKLSLWLDSFTVGAPLSFLDHHLKVGNSLIGTTVKEVKQTLELDDDRQIEAFGGPFTGMLTATELMREVSLSTDATFSEIKESIGTFREYEKAVKPYKRLLDLWISRHFDNEKAIVLLRQYPHKIIKEVKGEESDLHDNYVPVLKEAEKQADDKKFFHWELEFPEVFVDLKQTQWLENPGFDAVVGNPPYIRIQELREVDTKYYNTTFSSPSGNYDIYSLFVEKGGVLLNTFGRSGYILPHKFFQANYGEGLRKWLSDLDILSQIVDFGSNQVFENVTTYTCLLFLEGTPQEYFQYFCPQSPALIREPDNLEETELSNSILGKQPWNFSSPEILEIRNRLQDLYPSLGEVTSRIYQGLKTSADAIYIVNEIDRDENHVQIYSPHCEETFQVEDDLFHRLIKGGDATSYHFDDTDRVILFPYDELDDGEMGLISSDDLEQQYPLTWDYLLENREYLEAREDGAFDDENWYRFGRSQAIDIISEPKIFTPDFSPYASFAYDEDGNRFFTGGAAGGYGIKVNPPYSPLYMLALLNSKLLDSILSTISTVFRGGWYSYESRFIKHLPIRNIEFSTPEEEREQIVLGTFDNWTEQLRSNDFSSVLEEIEENLSEEQERADIIHDLLIFLADKMIAFKNQEEDIQGVMDPFKFVNKGVEFQHFQDVLTNAIKYGQQITEEVDIGTVHHDIEELHLRSNGNQWILSAQLKHRDPETDWDEWIKKDGNIVRTTHDIYQLDLTDKEAHYWQQAFEVLDEFENSGNFPGGKTRSTFEKLMKSEVPVFDKSANIEPLIELREELAEVKEKIEKTDWLIDQVVYQLYGLNEEEIEIVEGSAGD